MEGGADLAVISNRYLFSHVVGSKGSSLGSHEDLLASVSEDGRLLVWDSGTGRLKHEFVPSKHLSSRCTCLAWMPNQSPFQSGALNHNHHHHQKSRKRKSSTSSLVNGDEAAPQPGSPALARSSGSEAIALGTSSGSVLIFSLRTGDVTCHFSNENGHTGRVNDVAWDVEGKGELFSCSDDGTVRQFHAKQNAVLAKFGVDCALPASSGAKTPIKGGLSKQRLQKLHSVCVHPSGSSVLVGSVSRIHWVDLDTKAPLKVFEGGHVGPVTSLLALTNNSSGTGCFLLSAGSANTNDQTVSLWDLSLEAPQHQGSSAKFAAGENVLSLLAGENCLPQQREASKKADSSSSSSVITFGAVTKSGAFLRFQHDLSFSKQKKPVKPSTTLQIASGQRKGANASVGSSMVLNVPILGARFVSHQDRGESPSKHSKTRNDSNNNSNADLQIAYGNPLQPSFEVLECQTLNKLTCLVRDLVPQLRNGHGTAAISSSSSMPEAKEKSPRSTGSTLVVPDTSGAKVIAPGPSMVADKPATPGAMMATKRKQPGSGAADSLSMSDRLRLLTSETHHKTTPPRTDSMCNLLLQGLNNKDRKILDSVLDRAEEDLIENTVRKLPFEAVIPLITELQHYIKGRGMVNQSHARWLRTTLQIHAAHLMSTPECERLLSPIYGMLEARTRHFSAVLQLKGKLDMMTKQIMARPEDSAASSSAKTQDALLVYQDDSSDDLTEAIDDLLIPASDAEDNWDLEDDKIDVDDDDDEEDDDDEDDEDEDSDVEEVYADESESDEDLPNGGPSNGNHKDIEMDSD